MGTCKKQQSPFPPLPSPSALQKIESFVLVVVGRAEEVSPIPLRFLSNMVVEMEWTTNTILHLLFIRLICLVALLQTSHSFASY